MRSIDVAQFKATRTRAQVGLRRNILPRIAFCDVAFAVADLGLAVARQARAASKPALTLVAGEARAVGGVAEVRVQGCTTAGAGLAVAVGTVEVVASGASTVSAGRSSKSFLARALREVDASR